MRAYTQSAAVTQFRTRLLLEVVFGVRAIIAGFDAQRYNCAPNYYFFQFSAVDDWSMLLRVVSALGWRRSVYNTIDYCHS